jgi:hypothetical protein
MEYLIDNHEDGTSWTDKYYPKKINELVGNSKAIENIIKWINSFNENKKKFFRNKKGKRKNIKIKISPDDKFRLSLSNSPKDCIGILNSDIKMCNASKLIRCCMLICYYFGIREIGLSDSAGISCYYHQPYDTLCGDNYLQKDIPLSMLFRLANKVGFYESMGSKINDYSSEIMTGIFNSIKKCTIRKILENNNNPKYDSMKILNNFIESFGDEYADSPLEKFIIDYMTKNISVINNLSEKRCNVIKDLLYYLYNYNYESINNDLDINQFINNFVCDFDNINIALNIINKHKNQIINLNNTFDEYQTIINQI